MIDWRFLIKDSVETQVSQWNEGTEGIVGKRFCETKGKGAKRIPVNGALLSRPWGLSISP